MCMAGEFVMRLQSLYFFQLREFVITCAVCLWLQIFGGVWGEDICGDDAAKETGSNFTNTTNSDREKKFY